jgi:type IV secretory pathway TraG/TraD family ATPase VirD4
MPHIYAQILTLSPVQLLFVAAALMAVFVLAFVAVFLPYFDDPPATIPDAHGSAGFASPQTQHDLRKPSQTSLPPGGLYLGGCDNFGGDYIALPRDITTLHTMVLGPTGSGKSRSLIMPNIAWINQASFFCTDPKGELWDMTSGNLQQIGMTVRRYAPTEPDASECFNWIPLCRDNPRLADNLARAIIESGQTKNTQQFWIDGEAAILSAIFIRPLAKVIRG